VDFALKLRLPEWAGGKIAVSIHGEGEQVNGDAPNFHAVRRRWHNDDVRLALPRTLKSCPLPDEPNTVAFMDGPVVLAGLCDEERALEGGADDPGSILTPDSEREWGRWLSGHRAVGQPQGLRFRAPYEVVDEPYTAYFPVRSDRAS
jgi:hypothetical protein